MSQARRAAPEELEVSTTISAPRRGRGGGVGAAFQRVVAPVAVVALVMTTMALTFIPMGADHGVSLADPLAAHEDRVANRASREFVRAPVEAALDESYGAGAGSAGSGFTAPVIAATTVEPASAEPTPAAEPVEATPAAAPVEPVPVEATPEATVPAVDWSLLGEKAGTRWVTTSVNVRTGPGTDYDVVTVVHAGEQLPVTASTHDGWQQVSLKSGAGWMSGSYLTDVEPAPPSTQSSADSGSSSGTGSSSSAGTCSRAGNATSGMTRRTVNVLQSVCAQFSGITSYGGYRAGASGYHGSGQAIDAMISGESGWEVARWVRNNASSLGVVEVIYQQKIWSTARSGEGWRGMSDRGSTSANHYDHVHISVG